MSYNAREIKRLLGLDVDRAVIGDINGLTTEGLPPGYVRVRRRRGAGYGPVEYVWAFTGSSYPMLPGVEVFIGYDPYEGGVAVLRATRAWLTGNNFDSTILNLGTPKYNAGWVDLKQALPLLSHATQPPSEFASLQPMVYIDDNYQIQTFSGANDDLLTSFVPSAGQQRLVLRYLNTATQASGSIASTAKSLPDSVDPITFAADVQECLDSLPPRSIVSAAWRLQNNQSTIVATDIFDDLRQWLRPLPPRMTWDATAAPGVNDDSGSGYGVGSIWIDVTNDNAYICVDDSVGAAVWVLSSATGAAPADATYILQTADGDLPNAQALGALATGLMVSTTTTGVVSTVAAPSGAVVGTTDTQTLTNKTIDGDDNTVSDLNAATVFKAGTQVALENGGTEADLSATGPGLVYQPSAGAALTVVPAPNVAWNYIGNPGFRVAFGDTSVAFSTGQYACALHRCRRGSNNTGGTVSRQVVASPNRAPYALRVQRDSGNTATGAIIYQYMIETQDTIALRGKTLSIHLRLRRGANFSGSSNELSVIAQSSTDDDQTVTEANTGGILTNATTFITGTATLGTSFAAYHYTGTVPSNANTILIRMAYTPAGTAGADDWFEIYEPQLYLGSQVNIYQDRHYSIEEGIVHRYYWKREEPSSARPVGAGVAVSSTDIRFEIWTPGRMLQIPAITVTSLTARGNGSSLSASLGSLNAQPGRITGIATVTGATTNQVYALVDTDIAFNSRIL